MDVQKAWQRFVKTGAVEDYLQYRQALHPSPRAPEEEKLPHAQVFGRHRHSGSE